MQGLYSMPDFENLAEDRILVQEAFRWIREFCGQPHRDLGRPGPVCPFVPGSIRLNALKYAVIRGPELTQQKIVTIVRSYMDPFLSMPPVDGPNAVYKSIVLIFPDITSADASTLIDDVQIQLKPHFVQAGLMIGEFHNGIERPSIHSQRLHPYRSPMPMLVIRSLLESDFPFLLREIDPPASRIQSLESYLARRSLDVSEARKRDVIQAIEKIRGDNRQDPTISVRDCEESECPE